jgi:Protein of unknown function (DUF3179)
VLLAQLAAVGAAAAQDATNQDRSDYTDLRDPYPVRAAAKVVAASAAALRETDIVLGVALGGEARAYPVSLMWGPEHEVVNDTLGGRAIATTWCPLAHSGVVYDRLLEGKTLEIGNRGVDRGTLLLYDAASGSWWSQVFGQSVRGPLRGRRLGKLLSTLTTWKGWKAAHPDTTVYVDPDVPWRARFTEESFARMTFGGAGPVRNEDWIVGIEGSTAAKAWPLRRLAGPRLVNDDLERSPVVVILCRDDATVRVFSRRVGERTLNFLLAPDDDRLSDRETRSVWDAMTGRALSGPLAGRALEPVIATSALWYAWKTYRPDTALWGEPRSPAPRPSGSDRR